MATTWNLSPSHSSRLRRTLENLLEECGVQINGYDPWDIRVFNEDFYARVLHQGSLGFGESYMERWWDVGDLEELIYRLLKARLDERVRSWRDVLDNLASRPANGEVFTPKVMRTVGSSIACAGRASGALGSASVSLIATSAMPVNATMSPTSAKGTATRVRAS